MNEIQPYLVVVQLLSCFQHFETPWTVACQASLSFIISWSLLKVMSIESVMLSNHSSSVTPFSCPQSFPASQSFPMSQLFASGGLGIGASASASVLTMNIQAWFPFRLAGLISVLSRGLSRDFFSTTIWKHQFLSDHPFLRSSSHICMWLPVEKHCLKLLLKSDQLIKHLCLWRFSVS